MNKSVALIITIVIDIICLVLFSCCVNSNEKKSALTLEIEGVQNHLPLDFSIGKITEINLFDNCLNLVALVDEDNTNMEDIFRNKDLMKENLITLIKMSHSEESTLNVGISKMMSLVAIDNCAMKFIFRGSDTGKEFEIYISSEDIHRYLDSTDEPSITAFEYIDRMIASSKEKLPKNLVEGIDAVDIYKDGNYLYFVCSLDESLYSLEDLSESINSGEIDMMEDRENDSMLDAMCKMLKQADMGLVYRYIGNSSKGYVDKVYESDDL